jgi:hypothetical protein
VKESTKNDFEKEGEGENRNTTLRAAEANKKQNSKKNIFRYGPASILSTVSNLVFLFHPFMAATKLTNPTT